jgi:membrane glycosyltransferase
MTLLLLPKFLSLIVLLTRQRRMLARFGGAARLVVGVLAETLFSILLAPTLAALHTRFVVSVLMGRKVKWAGQDRGDVETRFGEAVRRHLGLTVLGAIWSALLLVQDRPLFWWLSPVLAGLVLSIPFSYLSGKVRAGRWTRRHALFLTPEEVAPPAILRGLEDALRKAARRTWAESRDGLDWVRYDPEVRAIHLALLERAPADEDPLARHRLEGLLLKVRTRGASSLRPAEKRELLHDRAAVLSLAVMDGARRAAERRAET